MVCPTTKYSMKCNIHIGPVSWQWECSKLFMIGCLKRIYRIHSSAIYRHVLSRRYSTRLPVLWISKTWVLPTSCLQLPTTAAHSLHRWQLPEIWRSTFSASGKYDEKLFFYWLAIKQEIDPGWEMNGTGRWGDAHVQQWTYFRRNTRDNDADNTQNAKQSSPVNISERDVPGAFPSQRRSFEHISRHFSIVCEKWKVSLYAIVNTLENSSIHEVTWLLLDITQNVV